MKLIIVEILEIKEKIRRVLSVKRIIIGIHLTKKGLKYQNS